MLTTAQIRLDTSDGSFARHGSPRPVRRVGCGRIPARRPDYRDEGGLARTTVPARGFRPAGSATFAGVSSTHSGLANPSIAAASPPDPARARSSSFAECPSGSDAGSDQARRRPGAEPRVFRNPFALAPREVVGQTAAVCRAGGPCRLASTITPGWPSHVSEAYWRSQGPGPEGPVAAGRHRKHGAIARAAEPKAVTP